MLLLAGCGDPMETSDGILPAAGLAQRHNMRVHAVNPYAGDGPGANPGSYAPRAIEVIERYKAGPVEATNE